MTPILGPQIYYYLESLSNSRKAPFYQVERASIFLLSSLSFSNQEISNILNIHYNTVGTWRKRFLEKLPSLIEIEQNNPNDLELAILSVLDDKPRSGAPRIYTDDQRSFIIKISCMKPKQLGEELSHWNLPALVKVIKEQAEKEGWEGFENLCPATVSRILRDCNVKPHKSRYWVFSKEKYENPEVFKAKVKKVNATYHLANEIRKRNDIQHTHIVCFDELTGIQALERQYAGKPVAPNMQELIEFNYIRHGTTGMIGFFDVVNGTIFTPAFIHPTRTKEDFVSAINQVISIFPDDEWIFVGDNLNIHYSDSLVTHIAERLKISGLGVFNKSGILRNVQSRTQFLTEYTHRIRFVYTPIHCSWLNQIEIFFKTINTHLLKRGEYKSVEELEESIQKYLVQYNKFWAHPYKWTYNTTPLGD